MAYGWHMNRQFGYNVLGSKLFNLMWPQMFSGHGMQYFSRTLYEKGKLNSVILKGVLVSFNNFDMSFDKYLRSNISQNGLA